MGGDGTGDAPREGVRDRTGEDERAEPERSQPGPVAEPTAPVDAGTEPTVSIAADPEHAVDPGREPTAVVDGEALAAAAQPARSGAAAVLLNLTGLGLGYLYLRRRLRATAALVIVTLMVLVAFANDASDDPWLWRILFAAWVVATAVDAGVVAGQLPRPAGPGPSLRPVAVGVLAVVTVVAGHIGYAEAARATYASGLAAQARADCTEADRAFGAVTGPFELTLSRDVPAAAQRRAECGDLRAAEQVERAGDHAGAVAAYQAFRRDRAQSVLDPVARDGVRRALQAWAVDLRASGDLDGAIARYRDLLAELGAEPGAAQVRDDLAATHVERAAASRRAMAAAAGPARVDALRAAMEDLMLVGRELAGTPTAAGVPQGLLDTFAEANTAVAEGRFCDALPVLDYAVTLPESAGVSAVANVDRARSLAECALANFSAGNYTGATDRFERLVTQYPAHPAVPQARAALITAEVGRSAGIALPLPAPVDAPGSDPLLLYNAVATEVRVLVAGPTAHEVTLPPCAGCPEAYPPGAESCPGPAGKPSTWLRVRPGAYYILQDRADPETDESVDAPVTVRPGGTAVCVTVAQNN